MDSSKIRQKLLTTALFCCLTANFTFAADTPEQTEQFRYAMGLIPRQLYEEAAKVLSNILSEPRVFSQSDGALFWLGQCEYSQKNYVKAAGYYQKVLKDYPNSQFRDRAAYGLGWAHTSDNNPKSAAEAFAKVSKKDIDLWKDARLKRGYIMVKYKMDTDQMIRNYEELLEEPSLTEQQKYECHLQIGIGKYEQSIYRQALEHFDVAILSCPADKKQAIKFYISESYFRIKDYARASSEYSETIALGPDTSIGQKSAYSLGWCYINLGQADKALTLFIKQADNPKSVVQKECAQNSIDLLMNLHKYSEAIEKIDKYINSFSEKDQESLLYIKALALSRLGDNEKSLKAFAEFKKKFPNSTKRDEATYQSGLVQISMSRFKDAIKTFDTISSEKTNPDIREKAIYRIGECYFNLANITEAGNAFNKVIKLFPQGKTRIDALYQLGELAYMQNSYADALTAFEAIAAGNNELSSQALFRCGEVLMKSGDYQEAIKKFKEYRIKAPKGKLAEDALFKTGLCWQELKDDAQALAAYSQLMNAQGYFRQEARFNIAEIARSVNNYTLAIQHYKAIISEDPKHPLATTSKTASGICLYAMKDYEGAKETFTNILKEYPSTDLVIPETRLWLGRTLIASKDTENGILELLKVPVLYPKCEYIATAYLEAARAYNELQKPDKAKKMYLEVLKSNPTPEQRKEAEEATKNK
ncbi:MAG: tetratricopeptide repeat protein [Candidatus Riflebacteria bacterium]|nr:tetratricopeptide repeat protein [Candidatus Riflebacteria bacterium]